MLDATVYISAQTYFYRLEFYTLKKFWTSQKLQFDEK